MPTDYAKFTVKGLYSKNADYSEPKVSFSPVATTLTPDEYMHFEVNCDSGGKTFDLSMFSDGITMLIVKNNDTAINVTAKVSTAGDSAVDVIIPPGGIYMNPDVAIADDLVLTAASGAPECEVFVIGT